MTSLSSAGSLRDLIASSRARTDTGREACRRDGDDCAFLPFSRLEALYGTFPLIRKMGVAPKETHKCVTFLLKRWQDDRGGREDRGASSSSPSRSSPAVAACEKKGKEPKPPPFACACGAHVEVDHARADRVCVQCGATTYGATAHCAQDAHACSSSVRDDDDLDSQLCVEVDHWNVCAFLGLDALQSVKRFASRITKRASNEQRIAAAFVFQYLLEHCDLNELTQECGSSMCDGDGGEIRYEAVAPTSRCNVCGDSFFNRADERRHRCRVRLQRPQVSLVKNKAAKMCFTPLQAAAYCD